MNTVKRVAKHRNMGVGVQITISKNNINDNELMIMNLYSAKSIEEYSKALYIKLKKIEIKKLKFENS